MLGIPHKMEEVSRVEIGLQFVTVESWDKRARPPIRITEQIPITWNEVATVEIPSEDVTIKASPEVIEQLGEWSGPVQVRISKTSQGHDLEMRSVPPLDPDEIVR